MDSMTDDIDGRLVAGFWQVVATEGWDGLTLSRLAAASGLTRLVVKQHCESPEDLLRLHGEVVDRLVREGTVPGQGGTPRDRVFDILMRRIDAMQPHRAGIVRLLKALPREPCVALTLARLVPKSMAKLLEAAEVSSAGVGGALRVQGVTAVWLATMRAWMADDSSDLGHTMAALDRALDRAEQAARSFRLEPGDLAA
jgi:AcrR family transcriptional regulator